MSLVFHAPLLGTPQFKDTVQNSFASSSGTAEIVSTSYFGPRLLLSGSGTSYLKYSPDLHKTSRITIAFWYCPQSYADTNAAWKDVIRLHTTSYDGTASADFRLEKWGDGNTYHSWHNNGLATSDGGVACGDIRTDYWYHIILSVDTKTGYWKSWLYDYETGEVTYTTNNQIVKPCYFDNDIYIIKEDNISNAHYSDIRIYDDFISDKEISELRKRPLLHYSFSSPDSGNKAMQGIYNFKDNSGNDLHPVINNAYIDTTSRIGVSCANFVASDKNYISIPRDAMSERRLTFNAWAYMDDWSQINDYSIGRIASCTQSGGWNFEYESEAGIDNTYGSLVFDANANAYRGIKGKTPSELGHGWHMFTLTFDGSYARQYVDGELTGQSDLFTNAPEGRIKYNTSNNIILGAEAGESGPESYGWFNGKMNDVKIYATALSEEDIKNEFNTRAYLTNKNELLVSSINENNSKGNHLNQLPIDLIENHSPDEFGPINGYIGRSAEYSHSGKYSWKINAHSGNVECYCYTGSYTICPNHIYYVSVWAKQIGLNGEFECFWSNANGGSLGQTKLKNTSNWQLVSLISSADWVGNFTGTCSFRIDYNYGSNNTNIVYYDDLQLIDLTEYFGAGNEPTKEQCDMLFNNIEHVDITREGILNAGDIVENQYYYTTDGAKFLKIFSHDIRSDSSLFPLKTSDPHQSEAQFILSSNRFSRLKDIPQFISTDGKYEFLLRYPELSEILYNRWRQTANPLTTLSDDSQTVESMGYEPIEISWSDEWYYGMGVSNATDTYLDCNAGHAHWYGGIGVNILWEGGFPAPNIQPYKFVELYVRVDSANYVGNSICRNIIPNQYQELDFIENSDTQYIDTNYIPNSNTEIEIKFKPNSVENSNCFVFGAGGSAHNDNAFELYAWTSTVGNQEFQFHVGSTDYWPNLVATTDIHTLSYKNKIVTYDNESYQLDHQTNPTMSLQFFRLNRTGGPITGGSCRIYYCKIWENGTLVRDFKPCYDTLTKRVGMYDLVTNSFYDNVGTNDFIKGNPVNPPIVYMDEFKEI